MTLEEDQALMACVVGIVESLKLLGYQRAHYTQMQNENGQLILAASPDGKTNFAIQVKTWKPVE
jgi:hypothetical protein